MSRRRRSTAGRRQLFLSRLERYYPALSSLCRLFASRQLFGAQEQKHCPAKVLEDLTHLAGRHLISSSGAPPASTLTITGKGRLDTTILAESRGGAD
jgi:hypothetical protein